MNSLPSIEIPWADKILKNSIRENKKITKCFSCNLPCERETNEKIEKNKFNLSEYNFFTCFKGHIDLKQNSWIVPIVRFIFMKEVYFQNSTWNAQSRIPASNMSELRNRAVCDNDIILLPCTPGGAWLQLPSYRRDIKSCHYIPGTGNQANTSPDRKVGLVRSGAESETDLLLPGSNLEINHRTTTAQIEKTSHSRTFCSSTMYLLYLLF